MELVDDGIALMRRDAGLLIGVGAVVSLPLAIAPFVSSSATEDAFEVRYQGPFFLVAALSLLVTAAVAAVIDERRLAGEIPSVGDVVPPVLRRIPHLVGAWLVVHVLEAVGVLSLGIFTLIVLVASIPVTPIVMIERLGPIAAYRRSWALTKGSRWLLFAHVLTVVVLTTALGLVQLMVLLIAEAADVETVTEVVWAVGSVVVTALSNAVVGASTIAVYRDLRKVREGSELAERISRMNV